MTAARPATGRKAAHVAHGGRMQCVVALDALHKEGHRITATPAGWGGAQSKLPAQLIVELTGPTDISIRESCPDALVVQPNGWFVQYDDRHGPRVTLVQWSKRRWIGSGFDREIEAPGLSVVLYPRRADSRDSYAYKVLFTEGVAKHDAYFGKPLTEDWSVQRQTTSYRRKDDARETFWEIDGPPLRSHRHGRGEQVSMGFDKDDQTADAATIKRAEPLVRMALSMAGIDAGTARPNPLRRRR